MQKLPGAQAQGSNEQQRKLVILRGERGRCRGKVSAMLEDIKNKFTCLKKERLAFVRAAKHRSREGQNCSLTLQPKQAP